MTNARIGLQLYFSACRQRSPAKIMRKRHRYNAVVLPVENEQRWQTHDVILEGRRPTSSTAIEIHYSLHLRDSPGCGHRQERTTGEPN
jgi:hypothetical protein